jgi:hypothetical protein
MRLVAAAAAAGTITVPDQVSAWPPPSSILAVQGQLPDCIPTPLTWRAAVSPGSTVSMSTG